MNKNTKYYNVDDYNDYEDKSKKKKNYKSLYFKNMERKNAITNPYRRTLCELCHQHFTQSYTRTCYISNFRYGIVCKDCKKKHNLIEM